MASRRARQRDNRSHSRAMTAAITEYKRSLIRDAFDGPLGWYALGFRRAQFSEARITRSRGESEMAFQARLVAACEAADRGEARRIGAMKRRQGSLAYGRDAMLSDRTGKHTGRRGDVTGRQVIEGSVNSMPSHTRRAQPTADAVRRKLGHEPIKVIRPKAPRPTWADIAAAI